MIGDEEEKGGTRQSSDEMEQPLRVRKQKSGRGLKQNGEVGAVWGVVGVKPIIGDEEGESESLS